MLRYHIFFGTFLILSTIDFALTAPVLVQEKRQAYADVIMKRGDGDIAKLAEEYLTTWGKPIESSDTHTSSGTTPDPASSTTNPDSSCSASMQGLGARGNCIALGNDLTQVADGGPPFPDPPVPGHGPTDAVEESAPLPASSTDNQDPLIEPPIKSETWDDLLGPWSEDESLGWYSDPGTGAHSPSPDLGSSKELASPD